MTDIQQIHIGTMLSSYNTVAILGVCDLNRDRAICIGKQYRRMRSLRRQLYWYKDFKSTFTPEEYKTKIGPLKIELAKIDCVALTRETYECFQKIDDKNLRRKYLDEP